MYRLSGPRSITMLLGPDNWSILFVCKLRLPSCSHYEHLHMQLAYRRQIGSVATRRIFDQTPRLTKYLTAHITRSETWPV